MSFKKEKNINWSLTFKVLHIETTHGDVAVSQWGRNGERREVVDRKSGFWVGLKIRRRAMSKRRGSEWKYQKRKEKK